MSESIFYQPCRGRSSFDVLWEFHEKYKSRGDFVSKIRTAVAARALEDETNIDQVAKAIGIPNQTMRNFILGITPKAELLMMFADYAGYNIVLEKQ